MDGPVDHSNGSAPQQILVVDDDEAARTAMAEALAGIGRVWVAASAEEALELHAQERPALAITEVLLPMASGYEVCRTLKERHGSDLPVILVSDRRTHPADLAAGLLIGADDYVIKPVHPEELRARVRRRLRPPRESPAPTGRLTPREQEVMELLAQGLAARDIARRLFITERTVAKHVEHILAKLGVHNRAQAVAVALRGR